MRRTNLKLVESVSYQEESGVLWAQDGAQDAHSLHQLVSLPEQTRAECARYLLARYSSAGDRVLDPFCGSGSIALEALLSGRVPLASDASPLAVAYTRAKLEPADITEVTLMLQMVNLRKPVDVAQYREYFSNHFDIDTYREIYNLRASLQANTDRVANFIRAAVASLLHGHTASYLSVYTSPHVSLSLQEQEKLNLKRRQRPDYRAVSPRVLRKVAMALRDGVSSSMRRLQPKISVVSRDARDLSHIESGSIPLILTSPPSIQSPSVMQSLWLRSWFAGVNPEHLHQKTYPGCVEPLDGTPESWSEWMSEVLLESARVLEPGGRAAFNFSSLYQKEDQILMDLVQNGFSRYLEVEATLINHGNEGLRTERARGVSRDAATVSNRVIVLRRR